MSELERYVESVTRPTLVTLAIVNLPAFTFLCWGVIDSVLPPEPHDPDAGILLGISVFFMLFSVVASSIVAAIVILLNYWAKQGPGK
jgi:hypothetical protein